MSLEIDNMTTVRWKFDEIDSLFLGQLESHIHNLSIFGLMIRISVISLEFLP